MLLLFCLDLFSLSQIPDADLLARVNDDSVQPVDDESEEDEEDEDDLSLDDREDDLRYDDDVSVDQLVDYDDEEAQKVG